MRRMSGRARAAQAAGNEEQRLLEAIQDDHEADGPRLAWADWLAAQGDPWGEVVRSGLKLAAKGKGPSRALLAEQHKRRANGLGPLAPFFSDEAGDVSFDRGVFTGGVLVSTPPGELLNDPRWRGVTWLHQYGHSDVVSVARGARLDRLRTLRNVTIEQIKPQTPDLLEPFVALDRLALYDMTESEPETDPTSERIHGWIAHSPRARAQLKMLHGMNFKRLGLMLREARLFRALEAVRFDSFELDLARSERTLFLYGFETWIESSLATLPRGALSAIHVDARVADKRKTGRAALKTLAATLGARLHVHTTPVVRPRLVRWDWY
jgi:uncharacterized protein (TIGR02996 family)